MVVTAMEEVRGADIGGEEGERSELERCG